MVNAIFMGLFSGVLLGLGTAPNSPYILFISLVPLFVFWIRSDRPGDLLLSGWVAVLVQGGLVFQWIPTSVQEFAGAPLIVGWVVWWLGVSWTGLGLIVTGWLSSCLSPQKNSSITRRLLAMVCILSLFETGFLQAIPWKLGFSFGTLNDPVSHLAPIIGASGLSFLVVLTNAALSLALCERKWLGIGFTLGLHLVVFSAGSFLSTSNLHHSIASEERHVLVVQPAIENEIKRDFDNPGSKRWILERTLSLTENEIEKSKSKIDLIVWPETAFPDLLNKEYLGGTLASRLTDFIKEHRIPLLTGAFVKTDNDGRANHATLFSANGEIVQSYRKQKLFPVGETVFGLTRFSWLRKFLPLSTELVAGDNQSPLELADTRWGIQICFEGLFSSVNRSWLDHRAQVLINISNDSWFQSRAQWHQHLAATLINAREVGLPVIRANNFAASGLLDRVNDLSPEATSWTRVISLPISPDAKPTFYSKTWWCLPLVLSMMILFLMVTTKVQPTRRTRKL